MEQETTIKSSSDDLKQQLAEIPSVHKPTDGDHLSIGAKESRHTNTPESPSRHGDEPPAKVILSCPLPVETILKRKSRIEDDEDYGEEESANKKQAIIPHDTWLLGGTLGTRNTLLIFRSNALANASSHSKVTKPGYKLHVTYKVCQAETKLLARLLDVHGIKEVAGESNDFNLLWTGSHPKPGVFRSLSAHQRINHFPRSYELTRKDRLYKNIERMQHSRGLRNFDFIPQTFIMPVDFKELCSTHYRIRGPWIVKPVASSRGRGIFIVESPYQVPLDEPVVVAKYINRPLLIDGHKCDLRLYVVVTSYDPLLIYIYEEGLVRFATVKYDTSHKQLWNPCMHLCNYSINKYHSDYIKSDDPTAENVGHKWTLSALLRYLQSQNVDTVQLMSQIEDIIVKAIITSANSIVSACQMFVPHVNNCFELFGFDILIDEFMKAWLLEVNLSPSLGCDSPLDVRLKSAMLADLLTLVGVPAVDPVTKPTDRNNTPTKTANLLKMKQLGSCRRVQSADGLSQTLRKANTTTPTKNNRLANSTLNLTAEESRILRLARSQFDRRGGWVRIFPTADSWNRYSQYLDPLTGIPTSSIPNSQSERMVIPHNFNQLVHFHLFPDCVKALKGPVKAQTTLVQAVGQRHNRYERHLNRGHRTSLDSCKKSHSKLECDENKNQVVNMLKAGKILTQGEARKTFSMYLGFILRRISINLDEEQESHVEVVLKFLQKASTYLRTPFVVKIPSSKLNGKDRAAIVAKQLNDFLYLYNRETELYSDTVDRMNSVPNKLFSDFLETAKESDLEEVLTLQTVRYLPPSRLNTTCGFQGLLKCFPSVTLYNTKAITNRNANNNNNNNKKTAIKVAKSS